MNGVVTVAKFKTKLKQLMLEKSVQLGYPLTQKEVAERTGLSSPAISRWYSGEVDRLEADSVFALMEYFACQLDQLIEVIGEIQGETDNG